MTRILAIVLASSLLWPSTSAAEDLTLRDVIELHRSGLGDELLIAVIEADGGPFSLSFADIHDLKSDGLSERVITALVRTGGRAVPAVDGGAPVVHVEQEVVNYVVPAVVVVDTPAVDRHRRQTDRDHGSWSHRDADGSRPRPSPPPPAMWMTRQEDGKNVTADGKVRRHVPPAAWVTPRDPKADHKGRSDNDTPRSDDKPSRRR